jgi:hypothetical protein
VVKAAGASVVVPLASEIDIAAESGVGFLIALWMVVVSMPALTRASKPAHKLPNCQ